MTCVRIAMSAGPCSSCGTYVDGLHVAGDANPKLFCPRCCPAEHGTGDLSSERRLVLELAVQTLHSFGHTIPARFNAAKALELCRIHAGDLPEELRRLLIGGSNATTSR